MKIAELKEKADLALQQTGGSYRKLYFLYAAISWGLAVLVMVLDAVLAGFITETGGLAGMQTRAILSTAQSALQILNLIATPFLQFGIVFCSMGLLRQENPGPASLLEGFRRFGPVLRLMLMNLLILIGLWFVCCYAAVFIFMLTPLSNGFMELMESVMEITDMTVLEEMLMDSGFLMQMLSSMVGYFALMALIVCVVGVPLGLRMSMKHFVVMDRQKLGGAQAIRESFRLTKGNCMFLLRLGLSFWWYYVLWALASSIVFLPIPSQVGYWISYGVYIAAQVALTTFAAPRIQTTYAAAYDAMKEQKDVKQETVEA